MCIRDRYYNAGRDLASVYDQMLGLIPVSYTHLDVYKRQAMSRAGGKTAAASFITKNVLPQMNAVSSSADFALACVECMGISPTFDREKWIKRKWTLHRFGGTIKIIKTQGGRCV